MGKNLDLRDLLNDMEKTAWEIQEVLEYVKTLHADIAEIRHLLNERGDDGPA